MQVGSGTDPAEGAALAAAVLSALAERGGFTMTSTHHAELNAPGGTSPRLAPSAHGSTSTHAASVSLALQACCAGNRQGPSTRGPASTN